MRHESAINVFDDMVLGRAVDRESVRIAVTDEHRRRLNDFYESYVRGDQLQFCNRRTEYLYGRPRFSGVSRGGTMISVRHRQLQPGQVERDGLTLVTLGSLDSDDIVNVHDNYCETFGQVDGTSLQRILVGVTEPEPSGRLKVDEFVTAELLRKELDEYVELGTVPILSYAHGRWSYQRHDGYIEPLGDLERVYHEVMAIHRRIGRATLRALDGGEKVDPTGQFNEKVVA